MKNILAVILGAAMVLTLPVSQAVGQQNPGDVWVPEKVLPGGEVIPGSWRPPFQKGFYWVEGKEDGNGNWIPGHWRPVPGSQPRNRVWAPGYWNGMIWVDGFWRPAARPGFIWVDPRWRDGQWHGGHWRAYLGGQPWRSHYPRR